MKVYLVKVSANGPFKDYKRSMGGPPQNIFAAAAATPDGIDIDLCDETIRMSVNHNSDADLIALFFSTPDAIRAFELASKFRARGKTVVMGGLHASALPDEALEHADAVIIGELEEIWEECLEDFRQGCLKERYQRTEPFDLAKLKPYPTDLITPQAYGDVWSVVVSRGCPYRCGFCTIPDFFRGQRYRPVEDVVKEIKNSGSQWVELHADNLLVDRKYAVELFKALIPLNIQWMGETSINLAKDRELLALAAESGLRYVLLGLETPSDEALKGTGKKFVKTDEVKRLISHFTEHGIEVDSSFIFGFDEHQPDIFQTTLDYVEDIQIQSVHSVILIPFPGTAIYRQLEQEGRLLTRDWSLYDGVNAVFQPKGMTVSQLRDGAYWFHNRAESLSQGGGGPLQTLSLLLVLATIAAVFYYYVPWLL